MSETQLTYTDLINFFEIYYKEEIANKIRKNENFLVIDFMRLAEFDSSADYLLDKPEEWLELAEQSFFETYNKKFNIRITNLPENCKIRIKDIRSNHISKLIVVEGVIKQKSDVRPKVTSAKFECPSCGNILNLIQLDSKFREPQKCSCGRKGKFKLFSKNLIDVQSLKIEELPEALEGGEQPKYITVLLKNDLVSPLSSKKINPGNRIKCSGILKEIPIILRSGVQSTNFDLIIEANYIETISEDFYDINISGEEKKQILELAKDPLLFKKLAASIAPSVWGHDKIKEALVLQLAGGVRKKKEAGVPIRGDIHILLVGDPGSAKSQILKRISGIAPKSLYVSGKGATGAGLSATVVRDELLQGWSLEAGALILAHKGICCIDEIDKMSKEDMWAMHEALEQQTITISKANIQASLKCETAVLAAANPKWGRFDPYDTVSNQIDLPPTLINRFDLIFPIKDIPDLKKDEKMAKFILELHKQEEFKTEIPTKLLRKYFAYIRQNIAPKLTEMAIEEIKNYYLKMRSRISDQGIKTIPISPRQLESLIRLAEASAKVRLSDKVTRKDARKAIELIDYCLHQVAYDEKTGLIDIDRIVSEIPATQRNKIMIVKDIISQLENSLGKIIPLDDLIKLAEQQGINEAEAEEIIQKLKKTGDIFEPKHGFISRIG